MSLSIFDSFPWQPITNWHFERSYSPPQQLPLSPRTAAQARRRDPSGAQAGSCQPSCCRQGKEDSHLTEILSGFCLPEGPMWGMRSTVRNDFRVMVGGLPKAHPVWRAWEWWGRCLGLMHGSRSGQLPFVSSLQLRRHDWGAALALHNDWAGREGESQGSTPSLAMESRCLERRREGRVDMGGLPGSKAAGSSWGGDTWHVWAD